MQTLYKLPNYYLSITNNFVDTDSDIVFLDKVFKKYRVNTVLDVACGVGRHAIPLAKKGYKVKGIDISPYQIKMAKENARTAKTKIDFILQDANTFYFPEKFDAAMCMWSTLGEEPMQYKKVIKNVFANLKSGGVFVIDNRSWEYIPKSKESFFEDKVKTKDGIVIETKIHDRYLGKMRIRDSIYCINGKKYKDVCITHILKEKDWIKELKEAGFKKIEVEHCNKPQKEKNRLYIIAIK